MAGFFFFRRILNTVVKSEFRHVEAVLGDLDLRKRRILTETKNAIIIQACGATEAASIFERETIWPPHSTVSQAICRRRDWSSDE